MSETEASPLSPAPLMQIVSGFWAAKTLASAQELDIFSKLSGNKGATPSEIAQILGLEDRPAELLVTACAGLGLLEVADGRYFNSALSENFLVRGRPYYFGAWVEFADHQDFPAWMRLTEALRTNQPTGWDPKEQDTIFVESSDVMLTRFWQGMHSLSVFTARTLGQTVDFTGVKALLDVGGGGAAYDIELCRQYPHLRAAVFDLPFVCDLTHTKISEVGMSERILTVPGDFFGDQELPTGYDAILLSMILHDWGESEGRLLLGKCFEALPPGGQVLISELLVNDQKDGPADAALMGLAMLVETTDGRNYTGAEYQEWLRDAGFTDIEVIRFAAPGANGVVRARKPAVTG
uniref:Methyltransferase n=1 Tax=Streptomyces sp. WT6 TaxID=1486372 RepID=A0A023PXR7_9ACTN|nr:hypothetical protein wt6.37c [Streptomyces sp. WT6]